MNLLTNLNEWLWQRLAKFLSRPAVTDWLIRRATPTPYAHLQDPDGSYYMLRYWLLNPYQFQNGHTRSGWRSLFPSVRLHHIMREDLDPHLHDHPWEARTIILRGGYVEERHVPHAWFNDMRETFWRMPGETCKLSLDMFHNITHVPAAGAWTLFITWKYQGTWGFRVDGEKVGWREYLGPDNKYGRPLKPRAAATTTAKAKAKGKRK